MQMRSVILFILAVSVVNNGKLAEASVTKMDATEIAQVVASRPANEGRVGTMHFRLQNSKQQVRTREAIMLHSDKQNVEKIAIFFTSPARIQETAFLSLNYETMEDENWLFLPVTDRVRRLPTSDRGDYFLGTDLTYGDIKDNFKFALDDWEFGLETSDESFPVLRGRAKSTAISKEMGYLDFRAKIDLQSAFPIWIEYTDADGDPLKRVEVKELGVIGGAYTALHFIAENLQTGHITEVKFSNMRYVPDLHASVFDPALLGYGLPDVED